jgi:hypothetical protein
VRLITVGSRKPAQHKKPCSDCPWRRDATAGWLGTLSADEWIQAAHGEAKIDCHVNLPWQCVGATTYRANVCKSPRDRTILAALPDRVACFASRDEFVAHHVSGARSRARRSGQSR